MASIGKARPSTCPAEMIKEKNSLSFPKSIHCYSLICFVKVQASAFSTKIETYDTCMARPASYIMKPTSRDHSKRDHILYIGCRCSISNYSTEINKNLETSSNKLFGRGNDFFNSHGLCSVLHTEDISNFITCA